MWLLLRTQPVSSLLPSSKYWYTGIRSPLSQGEKFQLLYSFITEEVLQPSDLLGPLLNPLQSVHIFLWRTNCEDQNWTQHSRCILTSTEQSGMIPYLSLLVITLWMESTIWLTFIAVVVHCWLMFRLLSFMTPRSLSARQFPCHADPSPYRAFRLCHSRCMTCHLSWLNFMLFLLAHSSSLSKTLYKIALPPDMSTSPSSWVSTANLARVL